MTTTQFFIGQTVTNFGQEAVIVSFHSETGDPILQDKDGLRWVADATKCEPQKGALRHRDGLIAFA